MSKIGWVIAIVAILALVLTGIFLFGGNYLDDTSADNGASEVDTSDIDSQSGEGLIENSIVDEGDEVELGDLLE